MIESRPNFKALFLGDIVGSPGRRAVLNYLPLIKAQRDPDLVVVNAENAADDGLGLLEEHYFELRSLGVDVVTTGNHVWEKTITLLETENRLLRPANYPAQLPGKGHVVFAVEKGPHAGVEVAVLNLQGRYRMTPIDDPFQVGRLLVEEVRMKTKLIFIDFHAEDFSEKEAFPWAMDGKVTAVLGTHTHVATKDARLLPQGCATQTDLGMCGPRGSVIGSRPDVSIERSLTAIPLRNLSSMDQVKSAASGSRLTLRRGGPSWWKVCAWDRSGTDRTMARSGLRLLDYLVNLFPDQTREALYARILCGDVDVEGERIKDPKAMVSAGAGVALSRKKFVSRGGLKLEAALERWKPPIEGRVWMDAGASTGGFTDCLLQNGAALIHTIDVGSNQLAWKLRSDPRVLVQEKTNIMDVDRLEPMPFGATADLSFRSLRGAARKILSLTAGNLLVALVKPQFEWLTPDPEFSGIVPDELGAEILKNLFDELASEGLLVRDCIASPVRGLKGNLESLVWLESVERPSAWNV